MSDRSIWGYTVALGGGVVLWVVTTAVSGRSEAWDSPLYWQVTYPLAILLAGALGYRVPQKPWRWGLLVMVAQAVALAIASSEFGLLPLGLILFGLLSLPAIGLAVLAARIRLRREKV